ncbi:hypothetical protein [Nonomuraea sp. NPDC002799]
MPYELRGEDGPHSPGPLYVAPEKLPEGEPPADEDFGPLVTGAKTFSANQVVAYNLQVLRRERGWSQIFLAWRLTMFTNRPWSAAMVSAAERSWESGRVKRFDANELLALSRIFRVPAGRFLLAPNIDGDVAYLAGALNDAENLESPDGSHWFVVLREADLAQAASPADSHDELFRHVQEVLRGPVGEKEIPPTIEAELAESTVRMAVLIRELAREQERMASLTKRAVARARDHADVSGRQ